MNIEEIKSRHQLLAYHLDKTPFALIAWDAELKIISWSRQAAALFGWTENEVAGKHLNDFPLVYADDQLAVHHQTQKLLQGQTENTACTIRNHTKSGGLLYCTWYCSVLVDEQGKVASILSMVQDISEQEKKEAAINLANQRLSLISNATNDGIWEWNVEQNKVWANETFCNTFGYDPQTTPDFYNEWLARIHPQDKDVFLKSIYAALEQKARTWSGEFRFKLANGAYGFILQKAHFMYGADGKAQMIVGVDIDITNLKKAEAALRLSEEKFSKAFCSSPVPLTIIREKDRLFTDANDAYCRLLGYSRDEILQKPYTLFNIVSDADRFSTFERLQQQQTLRNHPLQLQRKDGTMLTCHISSDRLLIDGEQYLLTTLFDVTELTQAETALRVNQHQLELIYNTIEDVIFLLEVQQGEQYRFITANNAFLTATGLRKEQVVGQWLQQVIPEPSLSLVKAYYKEAINTRSTQQWEEETPYPAGTKTGIVRITPVYDERGRCIRLVGSVHDITEQKKAAEELARSYQEIRSLATHLQNIREEERTSIAREIHDELGQLLTALKMEIAWLKKSHALSAEQVHDRVTSASHLLDKAISTVRNIATELRPSILDDLGLVEALAWQCREFEKRYGIALHFTSDMPDVQLPRPVATAFFRIFQEALTNVARHAQATSITVALTCAGNEVGLKIDDNGIGFEPEKTVTRNTLGLIGMKERMTAINGMFELKTAPGKGTRIKISVPYATGNNK